MSTETPASRRVLLLVLPHQHGAWSALAAAFVLGVAAAGSVGRDGLLVLGAVLAGFVAQHAATRYRQLRQRDRRRGCGCCARCTLRHGLSRARYLVRSRTESTGPFATRLRAGGASLLYHLGAAGAGSALSAAGLLPQFAWAALLPATAKACTAILIRQAAPLPVRTVGFLELGHLGIFVGLVTLAYALAT